MHNKKLSKFLSLVLRHKPEVIGLNMDNNGWVDVEELIEKMNANGRQVNRADILEVVATNPKQRFKLDETNSRIRANQGHSIAVDVELKETRPPQVLYHGTAEKNRGVIHREGLKKMNRQHVHLSEAYETAINVGSRHGQPLVLKIDSEHMANDGIKFFLSENKVWLTDRVVVKYISF